MQVKCDYCSSWMEDSDEFCPNCGAANANLKRVANRTPRTIEELKSWYQARKLPPYEQTRFFIGENYQGARAFGIYEDGGEYVVYKNKADGSRAIRYRGKDEAYAVNELYLRLKEEILNQKNVNAAGRSSRTVKSRSGKIGCLTGIIGVFVVSMVMAVFAMAVEYIDSFSPRHGSYYLKDSYIYYNESSYYVYSDSMYDWWRSDITDPNWEYRNIEADKKGFIDGLNKSNLCGEYGDFNDLIEELGLDDSADTRLTDSAVSPYNIWNSHSYKDAYHTAPRTSGYYYCNGNTYYYLDDDYGARYGKGDNSGWYVYDDGWEYYCSGDDHDALGDELWYDDDDYAIAGVYDEYVDYVSGNVYYFNDAEAAVWDADSMATSFSDTTWYQEKLEAENAYDEYWEEHSSRSSDSASNYGWSDDSSWDWDSSDSWDSGSTDWDSDW